MSAADWSIGRRLGAGFGAVIALLVAFAIAVVVLNDRSVRAVREYSLATAPLREDAQLLERDILYVGLGVRNLWLDSNEARRAVLRTRLAAAEATLQRLNVRAMDPQAKSLYDDARRQAEEYLVAVQQVAAAPEPNLLPAQVIDDLRDRRELVLGPVRQFGALQAERTAAAMRNLDAAARYVTRGTLLLLLLGAALALVVGWRTARSVREPARRLVRATRALGGGDWAGALALAPAPAATLAPPRDELLSIAHAVGAAAGRLQDSDRALRQAFHELEERNDTIARQNEELQARNEELQAQNEEIQAQSEELQSQSEELQAQTEEIHAQNDQLRGQTEALREADARKSHFLAVLAHELRNPLAPMTTSIALLRRAPRDSDAGARALAVIDRQVRQLARLVDDLLDVARISQGKIRLQPEVVDLVAIVRECLDDLAISVEQRGLALQFVAPPAPLWVRGDRARLAQIAGNLVTNALKFTDAGGRIVVEVAPDRSSGTGTLTVTDTGIGMDAALLARLFEPFTQGEDGLSRPNTGLGLGLALVRGLVGLHGGTVSVASPGPGRGATFTVRLPLEAPPTRPVEARAERGTNGRWRVLLVEDNVDAALSLRAIIELDGHAVAVAHTGDDGLDLARRFRPHLVICDIGLPGIDGYTLARALRGDVEAEPLVLVALTAHAGPSDLQLASAAGFDRHYAKPLDPEQLHELYELLGDAAPAT